jgi:tryptophan 2,3-dioxygenase
MSSDDEGRRARELSAALERPIHNRALGKEVGGGNLDYEVYLKTRALYALQTPPDELTVRDEHLFQVMHQTQELWLKEVAFDVVALVDALGAEQLHEACAILDRIVVIQQCLANEMRIIQTLTPDTFLEIRRNLGNGSGLESPGYNRVLLAADAAEAAFDALLETNHVSLLDLYDRSKRGESRDGMRRVAELLIDWDEAFQTWLVAHYMLVRRTIGIHRKVLALDGFPTQALAPRMTKPLFPKLWDARVDMTQAWQRAGGHAPGAPRPRATEAPAEPESPPPSGATRPTSRVPPRERTPDAEPTP